VDGEDGGELAGGPVARGLAGDDRGDLLAAGGGCGGLGRAGLYRRGLPRLSGGVRTVMPMAVAAWGRLSSWLR
jgi:hypothetical protein